MSGSQHKAPGFAGGYLLKELRVFLGAEGFLLLQAMAVFPKPVWPLPYLLDRQLLSSTASPLKKGLMRRLKTSAKPDDANQLQGQESRLLKIGRLPWSRHAYMPDYLRESLLKALNRADRKKIRLAWTALLKKTAISKAGEAFDVPIALPKISQLELQNFLSTQADGSALDDAIFANILLGGKLGLLDFKIPRALARLLPGAGKFLDLRPALAAIALAALSIGGLHYVWQRTGEHALISYLQTRINQENAAWRVTIEYRDDTRSLADRLQKTLAAAQFQVSGPKTNAQTSTGRNTVLYAAGGRKVARRLAETLSWLTYGAEPELVEEAELPPHVIYIQLGQTYRHAAGFNDELSYPYKLFKQANDPKPATVPIEPDMVVIPPGKFLMGSKDGDKNEQPQHEVSIDYAFEIGKHEVTFAEYDRFAEATGRQLPYDYKWGRGARPVINASFDDAQAYARWLSQQTGKPYRLPTEAEWEYAARANSANDPFWGGKNAGDYAWFDEISGGKTQPVGQKMPNAFGLYDTAGNVWEWTQDCWHENYRNAPSDGLAWLAADGGDCSRRVVRGGSSTDDVGDLVSSFRYMQLTNSANNILGFRIARAL